MPTLRLSIVMPVVDDREALASNLPSALRHADQVIVSDGGSTDGSRALARSLGAVVVSGAPGRGVQLNRGAREADGDVLIFLHADTRLPTGAREQIESALAAGYAGGGSRLTFDVAGPLLRFGARWINGRTRLTRLPLGDQAQFLTRSAFDELGGFRDWPILEDLDLMRRLKRRHRVAVLDGPVVTSSRRFRKGGKSKTIAINWSIWTLYALGVSPHRLARWYRKVR
jgi:rSAM/selenodomain-associated transferase 2